jgi:hypothetical protein
MQNQLLQKKIDELRANAHALYRQNDFVGMIAKMEECWHLIPDPKHNNNNSFVIAEEIVTMHLEDTKNYHQALVWAQKLDQCSVGRLDDGNKEFILGKVYFEMEDKEKAKEQLKIAMQKSEGRAFEGEDKKYVNLLKKK